MDFFDRLNTIRPNASRPDDEDSTEKLLQKREQTATALIVGFQESVKLKGKIQNMSVKDINDIFFNDRLPDASGRCYNEVIDDFLAESYYYIDNLPDILEGYWSIVLELKNHITTLLNDGKTSDSDHSNPTNTALYLKERLETIHERTSTASNIYTLRNQLIDATEQLNNATKKLREDIYGKDNADGSKTPGIKSTIEDIKTTSDEIMPNIISLVGVFSSIIVVILSLITTSSTWLLNANETSVLIAFVVPSGIITLVICALTALVRAMINKRPEYNANAQTGKLYWIKQLFQRWGMWFFIAGVTFLIVCCTIQYCQSKSDEDIQQKHYLVKCVPTLESVDNSDDTGESVSESLGQELYIVQEIVLPTGELYSQKIPCTVGDIHADGYVYYCLLHQTFE